MEYEDINLPVVYFCSFGQAKVGKVITIEDNSRVYVTAGFGFDAVLELNTADPLEVGQTLALKPNKQVLSHTGYMAAILNREQAECRTTLPTRYFKIDRIAEGKAYGEDERCWASITEGSECSVGDYVTLIGDNIQFIHADMFDCVFTKVDFDELTSMLEAAMEKKDECAK